MNTFPSREAIEKFLAAAFEGGLSRTADNTSIIGMLIAPPASEFARNQVLPYLNIWHHRSDLYTHFFCAGYDVFPEMADGSAPPDIRVDGVPWYFHAKKFSSVIDEIRAQTGFRYSGRCCLILGAAHYDSKTHRARIDFDPHVAVDLEDVTMHGGARSATDVVESVFEFAKTLNEREHDVVKQWSDGHGRRLGFGAVADTLKGLLPKPLRALWSRGVNFATRRPADLG